MARYFLVQIGSIYLTSTGLVGGKPCKINVTGLDPLVLAKRRNVIRAISGEPFSQYFSGNKGIDIEITSEWMNQSVWDSLVSALDNVDTTETPIAISITGDPGDFTFNAVPNIQPTGFDSFSNGIIKGAKIRLITA